MYGGTFLLKTKIEQNPQRNILAKDNIGINVFERGQTLKHVVILIS